MPRYKQDPCATLILGFVVVECNWVVAFIKSFIVVDKTVRTLDKTETEIL